MKKAIKRTLSLLVLVSVLLSQSACGVVVWNGTDTTVKEEQTTLPEDDTETTADSESTADSEAVPEDTTAPDTTGSSANNAELSTPTDYGKNARERINALPTKDLSSAKLIIATTDSGILRPALDPDNALTYAQNDVFSAVEEKFNTEILLAATDITTLLAEAKNAYNTDMYYADLLSVPQNMLGFFHVEGILANMNSLPFANYSAPYYNQNINDQAKLGNVQFGISGAVNFNPNSISCVYFNRDILSALGIEDMYALVNEGKWTFDRAIELSIAINSTGSDMRGMSTILPSLDFIDVCATAQGLEYVNFSSGVPTVDFYEKGNTERADNIVSQLYGLLYNPKTLTLSNEYSARDLFSSGNLLFSIDNMSYVSEIADTSFEWGILPMPKYDEAQENYISPVSSDMQIFCALANTPNFETSGLLLESLNLAAYDYTYGVYKDTCVDYCLRDFGSVLMLDKIAAAVSYDFAHMFASGVTNLENATFGALKKAVTTSSSLNYYYSSYKSRANYALSTAKGKYE